MSQQEFERWATAARTKLDAVRAKTLSFEEFEIWLKK